MHSLYALLLFFTGIIPLVLSFDGKLRYYRQWILVIPSLLVVALLFIVPDVWFTRRGIWGFNEQYLVGVYMAGLPLEEWLFFIIIPYASLFIHYAFFYYHPMAYPRRRVGFITVVLLVVSLGLLLFYPHRDYTLYAVLLMWTALLAGFIWMRDTLARFYTSALIILVPFLLVNGILTGSFIEDQVVWYNEAAITGIRVFTIPLEDFLYGFSLIFLNLFLVEFLRNVNNHRTKNP